MGLRGEGLGRLGEVFKLLKKNFNYMYPLNVCVCLHVWVSEDKMLEFVLFFYHEGPGEWTQSSGLVANIFIHWTARTIFVWSVHCFYCKSSYM